MAERKKQTVVSSGISGLDEILRGGLPASNLYIVQGAPGSGKTTAALQFLRAGVARGERCIYVSLSQTRAELESIALSHGWTLDGIRVEELSASDSINRAADQTIFQTTELRLDETRKTIESAIEDHKPSRLVYDSLLEIRLITGDSPRFRREQLRASSAIHRPLDCLQAVDLAFRRTVAPRPFDGVADGVKIEVQGACEPLNCDQARVNGIVNPGVELARIAAAKASAEAHSKAVH